MELSRRKKISATMNITPLIDIVFLQLIFFMVGSKFVTDRGITVRLPAAENAGKDSHDIIVVIEKDGAMTVNDRRVDTASIEQALRQSLAGAPERRITIRADREVHLELAVLAMDAAKKAGAPGVTIATASRAHEKR